MPSFTESMSRAWHQQRISYVLPDEIDLAAAPSVLRIEGLGDLKMRHTRDALDGKPYLYADDHLRQPLELRPVAQGEMPVRAAGTGATSASAKFFLVLAGAALTAAAFGLGWLTAPVSAGALAACMVVGIFALALGLTHAEEDLARQRPAPVLPEDLAALA